MMTVVTHLEIAEGQEPVWDAAFRERVDAAKEQAGFVSVQLGIPVDAMNERVVIGTWETRADWEAWHASEAFERTRAQMDAAGTTTKGEWWYEVVLAEQR